jgi:hypothetical protein
LGFTVGDVGAFYREMTGKGVLFSMAAKKLDFGGVRPQFVDSEGAHCSMVLDSFKRQLNVRFLPAIAVRGTEDATVLRGSK